MQDVCVAFFIFYFSIRSGVQVDYIILFITCHPCWWQLTYTKLEVPYDVVKFWVLGRWSVSFLILWLFSFFVIVWSLSLQCTDWNTIVVQPSFCNKISFNCHKCFLFVLHSFHKGTSGFFLLFYMFCCFHCTAWTNSKWKFTPRLWSKHLPQCVSDFQGALSP